MKLLPEGRLRIKLTTSACGQHAVRLKSSRPLAASRVFEGRSVDESLTLVPLLFAVCAHAQSAAAVSAVEAATGNHASAEVHTARNLLVQAETGREHLLRLLSGWCNLFGLQAQSRALGIASRLPARLQTTLFSKQSPYQPGLQTIEADPAAIRTLLDDLNDLLHECVFGMAPEAWLQIDNADDLMAWVKNSSAIAPAYIYVIENRDWLHQGDCTVAPLQAADLSALQEKMHDNRFIAEPIWEGLPCETGAYARRQQHPMLQRLHRSLGSGLLARSLARLIELAELPQQLSAGLAQLNLLQAPATPALSDNIRHEQTATGEGASLVEAARGHLVHSLSVEQDIIRRYRILAPTEWNFHPQGIVAQMLSRLPSDESLPTLAAQLIESIDPCVGYELEISHHA